MFASRDRREEAILTIRLFAGWSRHRFMIHVRSIAVNRGHPGQARFTRRPAVTRRADYQVRLEHDLPVPVRAVAERLLDEQLGRGPAQLMAGLAH